MNEINDELYINERCNKLYGLVKLVKCPYNTPFVNIPLLIEICSLLFLVITHKVTVIQIAISTSIFII